jgi:hypothetical protein
MNNLSWMIYAADVAANVALIAEVTLFAGVIAGALCMIGSGALSDDDKDRLMLLRVFRRTIVPITCAAALLVMFVPSETTIYAIAASETGEEVLNSETGGKAVQALDAWLDRQIEGASE